MLKECILFIFIKKTESSETTVRNSAVQYSAVLRLVVQPHGVSYEGSEKQVWHGKPYLCRLNFSGNNRWISSSVALQIPRSVIKPVTYFAGVTSNA
jgi:hypothetical protein